MSLPINICSECGKVIPEGRHICLECEKEHEKINDCFYNTNDICRVFGTECIHRHCGLYVSKERM